MIFRGSEAVAAGHLTHAQLRGPLVTNLFRDVYADGRVAVMALDLTLAEDRSGRLARVDLAFPERKVAVEYDGEWRDGQLWALNHDRERLNRVHAAGWDVVFVTQPLLANPRKMIYTVEAALRAA